MSINNMPQIIADGGPVFPNPSGGYSTPGMALRDYFAAQALQAVFTSWEPEKDQSQKEFCAAAAQWAYFVADRMLEERNNPDVK